MTTYEEIKQLIESRVDNVVEELYEYHPFDIAQTLFELKEEDLHFFLSLETKLVASVISTIEEDEEILEIVSELQPKRLSNIICEMEIDDAVDILQEMEEEDSVTILRLMNTETRNEIKKLMNYPESSAGALMTTEYIEIHTNTTVKQAMRILIEEAKEASAINVIYIVDDHEKLIGTLSLRELIIARADEKIVDLMAENLITVSPMQDQSVVAELMSDYDLTVLPVVNRLNRMLGIVTIDDVVDVLVEEHTEDMRQLAGVHDIDIDHDETTVRDSVRNRFPWLLVLLFVGFLTSMIIASFEETISHVPILAMFMPLILNMSGNTGVQSLAVTVRGISTNQFKDKRDVVEHMWREFRTSLVNGILLSAIVFVLSYILGMVLGDADIMFSIIISVSIFLALVLATLAGAFIPLVINSLKIDPAVASGPFITTLNDIISLTVYLGLATIFIVNLA